MKQFFSKKCLQMAALLTMVAMPTMAFAQASGSGELWTLSPNDLSRKTFIEPLFGPLTGSGATSPLTDLMMGFNTALLVVGGILMAYTLVAGTMSTAHDGEMLGKKWSSMWIPIRTSIGVGAVMPVLHGWCVAQAIVVWLAMQGAGLANTLWDKFLGPDGGSIIASATYNPPTNLQAVRDAYAAMMINSTCVAAHQKEAASAGSDGGLMKMMTYTIQTKEAKENNGNLAIYYGRTNVIGGMDDGNCGIVMLEEENTKATGRGDNSTSSKLLDMAKIEEPVIAARQRSFIHARDEMEQLGKKVADGQATQQEVDAIMERLLRDYSTTVTEAAQQTYAQSVDKGFLQTMKHDGWVMAGAYYMQLSKTQDLITRSITNAPAVLTPPNADATLRDPTSWLAFGGLNRHSDQVVASVDMARKFADQSNINLVGGVSAIGSDAADSTKSSSIWVNRLVSWFINKDNTIFGDSYSTSTMDFNENPIIMAKGMGEKMTMAAWGALGSFALFTGTGAGGLGTSIAPVFSTLFTLMLVPGATLSTYLPMLPYILWLGVVIGWAILLIEAVVAAPLWAIVHIAPDGDGVVGRGGQGYMLVLSLVLRPPLMIIGLAAAFVLMKPIGFLVNSTFVGAFSLGVSPGAAGLTQALAGCIIYMVLMVTIVNRVFSLIHVIPDRLLRWIGGGGSELGQEAGALDQGSSQRMTQALQGMNQMNNSLLGVATNAQRDTIARLDRAKDQKAQMDLQRIQGIESARGDLNDKEQDARYASERAEEARSDGVGNPTLESSAAIANAKAARQSETLASRLAERDQSPEAQAFNRAMSTASEKERNGEVGASQATLDQATTAAQARQAQGIPLRPFEDALVQRAGYQAKQMDHERNMDSVKAARQESQKRQELAAVQMTMASEAKQEARSQGRQAYESAKSSSDPAAQSFVSSVKEARDSGRSGATGEVYAQATQQAYQAQQEGRAQPFQQALIARDQKISQAEKHEKAADRISNSPENQGVWEGKDEGYSDPMDEGTPPDNSGFTQI